MFKSVLHSAAPGHLPIFCFHKVPDEVDPLCPGDLPLAVFTRTLDFICDTYRVVPLPDMINRLQSGQALPHDAACITFDDGYAGWAERVAPLLMQREAHATFYITTSQFEGQTLWHERVRDIVAGWPDATLIWPGLGLPPLPVGTLQEKQKTLGLIESHLKYQSLAVREALLVPMEHVVGIKRDQQARMTPDEVRRLYNLGFEIGGHSVNHPILSLCDPSEIALETGGCREILEGMTGGKVQHYAYPNGRPYKDYNQAHINALKAAGYQSAVTTASGRHDAKSDLFQIPRFTPWGPGPRKMALQCLRNVLSQAEFVHSVHRPIRVMSVENGGGFGGAMIALRTLYRHMPPAACQFDLVQNLPSLSFTDAPSLRTQQVIKDRHINTRRLAKHLMPYRKNPLSRLMLFSLGRLDDVVNRLPYFIQLLIHALKTRPDIIHGNNDPASNREALWVARLLRRPYVQHLRGGFISSAQQNAPDTYITVSRWLAGEILARGVPVGKISHIYDGIELPDVVTANRAKPYIQVAMVGMLVPWKGQGLFLDAVDLLPEEACREVRFLVVGGTPELSDMAYENQLKAQVAHSPRQSQIEFTGRRNDMPVLFAESDVVISASTSPEPLGLVMLEALSAGCRFIAPAHGAATEVIESGKNGYLFTPEDAASLAEKLALAIEDARRHRPVVPTDLSIFQGDYAANQTLKAFQMVLDKPGH